MRLIFAIRISRFSRSHNNKILNEQKEKTCNAQEHAILPLLDLVLDFHSNEVFVLLSSRLENDRIVGVIIGLSWDCGIQLAILLKFFHDDIQDVDGHFVYRIPAESNWNAAEVREWLKNWICWQCDLIGFRLTSNSFRWMSASHVNFQAIIILETVVTSLTFANQTEYGVFWTFVDAMDIKGEFGRELAVHRPFCAEDLRTSTTLDFGIEARQWAACVRCRRHPNRSRRFGGHGTGQSRTLERNNAIENFNRK